MQFQLVAMGGWPRAHRAAPAARAHGCMKHGRANWGAARRCGTRRTLANRSRRGDLRALRLAGWLARMLWLLSTLLAAGSASAAAPKGTLPPTNPTWPPTCKDSSAPAARR
jgi:hypothetical protein